MNIFIDTNVLLDVLNNRMPYYADSSSVWTLIEKARFDGYISAINFNNIYYISRKVSKPSAIRKTLSLLRDIFKIVPLDEQIVAQAIDSEFKDFEDAIQYFSAVRANAECIISRNLSHYRKSDITVMTPSEFLASGFM